MQSISDTKRVVPAESYSDTVTGLAGEWRGRLIDATGNAESFNLQRDAAAHRLPGQFQLFTTPGGVVAGVRLLEASDRNVVVLIGPYLDPETRLTVVTVLEGLHDAQGMEGTFHTRRHGGRDSVRTGRFTATRTDAVTRAA